MEEGIADRISIVSGQADFGELNQAVTTLLAWIDAEHRGLAFHAERRNEGFVQLSLKLCKRATWREAKWPTCN
jgi:hypothetical protein